MAVIKQYVNFLPNNDIKEYGSLRTITVNPDQLQNVQPSDRIEFWAEPVGEDNVPNSYIDPAQRPQFLPPFSPLLKYSNGPRFEALFLLPQVGGNEYRIKACKQVDKRDPKKTVTLDYTIKTWRKLYYTVYYMEDDCLNTFKKLKDRFEQAFAKVFIEFENIATIATPRKFDTFEADPRTLSFLNGTKKSVMDLRPAGPWGKLDHKPFNLALLIVPDCYYTKLKYDTVENIRNISKNSYTLKDIKLYFNPADPLSFLASAVVKLPPNYYYNVRDKFKYVSDNKVGWDLTSVPGLTTHLSNQANKFTIELVLVKMVDDFVGYNMSKQNFCIILEKYAKTYGCDSFLQTLTHEAGHALRQVVPSEKKWDEKTADPLPDEKNPNWHNDDYGGIGDHCSTNAVLGNSKNTASNKIYEYGFKLGFGKRKLCTMFWDSDEHVDRDGNFCTNCNDRLRRCNYDSVNIGGTEAEPLWNYFG
jgi:hypothetical protein